jgi:putative flippase GtrA
MNEPEVQSGASTRRGVEQFLRFGLVGIGGFVVDAFVLYAVKGELGLYAGRVVSYFAAATFTWAFNRRFTFISLRPAPRLKQWLEFLAANVVGAVANYGAYCALVKWTAAATMPVLAVAAGSIAGLTFNFTINKVWVFADR